MMVCSRVLMRNSIEEANEARASARRFWLWRVWTYSTCWKWANSRQAMPLYVSSLRLRVLYLFMIYLRTNWESPMSFSRFVPSSSARRNPRIKASYSAMLLVFTVKFN